MARYLPNEVMALVMEGLGTRANRFATSGIDPKRRHSMVSKSVRRKMALTAVLALGLTAGFYGTVKAGQPETVTVFAAASTTNALTDIGKMFEDKGMGKLVPSFASSSTLAKQIENGAPANLFISADEKWMSYLQERKLIDPSSRFDLLGNRLVLIAPSKSKVKEVAIGPGFDLAKLLGNERLAMGNPEHVPAGIYAKQALEKLGVWKDVEPKVARSEDVRAALTLVERGEAPFGIVYATDAAISNKVRIVGTFPEDTHPPVVYPAAIVAGKDTAVSKSFLNFLKTDEAKAVFKKYGFTVK